jgi:cysteinyl-tRNA synthetase
MSLIGRRWLALAPAVWALLTAAADGSSVRAEEAGTLSARLAGAKSWSYQLQKIKPDAIAAAPYDVFVLDYSRDGTDEHALTAEEIARLKVKPDGGRRIVLAYLSIGEAETYRFYWNKEWDPPSPRPANGAAAKRGAPSPPPEPPASHAAAPPPWLGDQNKRWRTNVLVRYWHPDWQAIVFRGPDNYLDRILKAGFDGIYLDRVDVYQELAKENPAAREQMIDFVMALAAHARARKEGFLIVPQNAEELLDEQKYRAAIDAIAKEDLLFGDGRSKHPNSQKRIEAGIDHLKRMTADRKPVFVVEYLDKPEDIASARKRLEELGFVPHFAKRGLDVMRIGDLPPQRPARAVDKNGKDKK